MAKAQTVSKAEFSRQMNLSKARISQLIQRGLPVTPEGKIDLDAGKTWIENTVVSGKAGWGTGLRAKDRDPKQERGAAPTPPVSLPGAAKGIVWLYLQLAGGGHQAFLAATAIQAGCPVPAAKILVAELAAHYEHEARSYAAHVLEVLGLDKDAWRVPGPPNGPAIDWDALGTPKRKV